MKILADLGTLSLSWSETSVRRLIAVSPVDNISLYFTHFGLQGRYDGCAYI